MQAAAAAAGITCLQVELLSAGLVGLVVAVPGVRVIQAQLVLQGQPTQAAAAAVAVKLLQAEQLVLAAPVAQAWLLFGIRRQQLLPGSNPIQLQELTALLCLRA
jgi:hypothetical protein